MYVVIRQLQLLRDEFRISTLPFHSDLLHSTLEKIPLFTPQLCGLDIGPGPQIARSVRSAAAPARPMGAAACVYNAHIESPSAPRLRPITARCTAVGLLPLLRQEFRLLKLILHSELRRRAASRRALPCPSSIVFTFAFLFRIKLSVYISKSNVSLSKQLFDNRCRLAVCSLFRYIHIL